MTTDREAIVTDPAAVRAEIDRFRNQALDNALDEVQRLTRVTNILMETSDKEVGTIIAERDEARVAIERVKALHVKQNDFGSEWCNEDGAMWPCRTLAAIEEQPMSQFRKKPVVIEARQFTWTSIQEVADWCGGDVRRSRSLSVDGITIGGDRGIYIRTLEGEMRADVDDWIIRGVQGEFYPCKPDIFEATYEPVELS